MMVSVAMSFLCLPVFDCWACTLQSGRIRQLSSIRVTRCLFTIQVIFWTPVNVHFLMYYDLVPPTYACWFTSDPFMQIATLILSPILYVILPLTVLLLFGLLTYRNCRFMLFS
ncbi:unnamed protein product [Rotaria socialis]|uniref:G-protein coupled receptors family 1 profile domain-containing protein n=1 Tax=Rotaria socialis TaxID=392032 RepID=A0A817T0S5_9BILA|nr:unnamed protein product [Rotaria socialis]